MSPSPATPDTPNSLPAKLLRELLQDPTNPEVVGRLTTPDVAHVVYPADSYFG